jgi:hypothetical protein
VFPEVPQQEFYKADRGDRILIESGAVHPGSLTLRGLAEGLAGALWRGLYDARSRFPRVPPARSAPTRARPTLSSRSLAGGGFRRGRRRRFR